MFHLRDSILSNMQISSRHSSDLDEDYFLMHILDCIRTVSNRRAFEKKKNSISALLSSKYRIFWQAVHKIAEKEVKEDEKSSDSNQTPLDLEWDCFPDNAKKTDGRMWLPLHFAVSLPNVKLADIQTIFKANPAAVKVPTKHNNNFNPFQLAVMTESPRMEIIEQFQIYYPEFASSLSENGNTPLHWAAAYSSLAMVRKLIKLYPAALEIRDKDGETPLHWAAACSKCVMVVRELAELYPAALEMRSTNGNTPFHEAALNSESVEIFRIFVSLSPAAVLVTEGADECAPLEAFASDFFDDIPEVVGKLQVLLEAVPQGARTAFCCSDNPLPLHYFLFRKKPNFLTPKTIGMLLAANREAVDIYCDGDGLLLPIHWAAEHASLEVMKMITEANISNLSVIVTDDDNDHGGGGSVAHYAVYGENLENLRYIHSLKPELFYSLDSENKTPLHILIENCYSDLEYRPLSVASDILRFLLRHHPSLATAEGLDLGCGYGRRLLLMAGALSEYPGELADLNFEARRGALLLFYSSTTTIAEEPNIFSRIRLAASDMSLMRTVISFL